MDPECNGSLTPTQVSPGSTRRVWWQCGTCSYTWETPVYSRGLTETGCGACEGKRARQGVNTLDRYPEVAALWDDNRNGPELNPSQVLSGSNKEHWWTCPKGHVWRAPVRRLVESYRIAQVRHPGQPFGCRQCTRRNQTTGSLPTLADSHPDLLEEWDWELNPELDPLEVTIGSDRRAWWRCSGHDHSWQSRIKFKSRARGSGCPFCSNKKVLPGFNDLATVNPELATYWHPTMNGDWLPTMVTARSSRKVYWWCAEGHVSYGSPASKCTVRGIVYSCGECHLDRRATRRAGSRVTRPTL